MNARTRISSKGQVVIPKAIRDALHLKAGETLEVTREGRRIVLETSAVDVERMSYDEFKRRVPAYSGRPVSIEDMRALSAIFADWKK
jgi:AbrB family looped-hinge helix DNA binding protein